MVWIHVFAGIERRSISPVVELIVSLEELVGILQPIVRLEDRRVGHTLISGLFAVVGTRLIRFFPSSEVGIASDRHRRDRSRRIAVRIGTGSVRIRGCGRRVSARSTVVPFRRLIILGIIRVAVIGGLAARLPRGWLLRRLGGLHVAVGRIGVHVVGIGFPGRIPSPGPPCYMLPKPC